MVLPMLVVGALAQGASPAHHSRNKQMEEAYRRGRATGQFYELRNVKNKPLSVDKVLQEAKAEGCLLGSYTTRNISRFGDVSQILSTLEFMPKDEYPQFVWEKLRQPGEADLSAIGQAGSCFVYTPTGAQLFRQQGQVFWSGQVEGGQLAGEGYGFFYDGGANQYVRVKGSFQHGIPLGECTFTVASADAKNPTKLSENTQTVSVGRLSDGVASFRASNGNYGFLAQDGRVIIAPADEQVLSEFSGGRAQVVADGKEIIIDKSGNFIDHTARQKQLIAEAKAEEERLAAEREQAELEARIAREKEAVERERLRAEAARRRIEKFRNCKPGDRVYYSQNWEHSDGVIMDWIFGKTSYTMAVICFVEQNVDNGERLQIRVGSVSSSNDRHYSTPEIDGIKYNKGDVLWIKPFENTNWQIE